MNTDATASLSTALDSLDLPNLKEQTEKLIHQSQNLTSPSFWHEPPSKTYYIPVKDGEIRVLHIKPEYPISKRPIVFVPGWGGIPDEYQDMYRMLHEKYELYYIETREKRSSHIKRFGAKFSMAQKANDVAQAIHFFNLENQDFVLFGGCWGAAVLLQGLMDKTLYAPTVVVLDPMHRLWYPQWMLNVIPVIFPAFIIHFLKPLLRWLQLRKMHEPRQKERAVRFIRAAVMWKWVRAAYHCRHFELYGNLQQIYQEVIVVNGTHDAIHDQKDYPKLAQEMPKGRFLRFETTETKREYLMGLIAGEFASVSKSEGVPNSLKGFEVKLR